MKKRRIIIIVIAAVCMIAAILSVCLVVIARRNKDTGLGVDTNFTIEDTLPDGEGRRATVIFLAGQSNASGCSRDEYLKKNVSQEKYSEYERGYDNVYINYFATGTNRSDGFVRCGKEQGEAGGFFGPELGLAESLSAKYPDRTFFIIKYAWGGSNLYGQWRSPSAFGKTGELYDAFVKYANMSIEYITSKNYDVRIEGMCWMQGESDSIGKENAKAYEKNLTKFIKDVRGEFSTYAAEDGIAFIDAYIAENASYWIHYEIVNECKKQVAAASDLNSVIDTVSAGLTCQAEPEGEPDLAHYDSLSQIKLGHLFAEELERFLD